MEHSERPIDITRTGLEKYYTMIYGTETVFCEQTRSIIKLSALRAAAGPSNVASWLASPKCRMVYPHQVVFDPSCSERGAVNLFDKEQMLKPSTSGSCEKQLELLKHLCSWEPERTEETYEWVLNWLAYPIQHPGEKMGTAVIMHGPQRTGKNLFWESVAKIFGAYGTVIGQAQLESQFNGYLDQKLFVIGDEVLSRSEKYHLDGQIKSMITSSTIQVNEKNLPLRSARNTANFVFLSNRIDVAKVDADDRRFCVIWTPPPREWSFYEDVAEEIDRGGSARLYRYLLDRRIDLMFYPGSLPPMTLAKQDLITATRDSVDRFLSEWREGSLPVPFKPCLTQQLYDSYKLWCHQVGVTRPAPEAVMLSSLPKMPGVIRKVCRRLVGTSLVMGKTVIQDGENPGEGETQTSWITKHVDQFEKEMNEWRDGLKR